MDRIQEKKYKPRKPWKPKKLNLEQILIAQGVSDLEKINKQEEKLKIKRNKKLGQITLKMIQETAKELGMDHLDIVEVNWWHVNIHGGQRFVSFYLTTGNAQVAGLINKVPITSVNGLLDYTKQEVKKDEN